MTAHTRWFAWDGKNKYRKKLTKSNVTTLNEQPFSFSGLLKDRDYLSFETNQFDINIEPNEEGIEKS